jgi:hypothetical protein
VSGQQSNPVTPPSGKPETISDQIKQTGTQAASLVTDVAKDAQTRAASLAGDAKEQAVAAAENQKEGIADQLSGVARALQSSSEQMTGQQDWLARLVETGGKELEMLADTLRTNDLRALMGKLDELARAQPAIFVGATMAAGFAAVRLGRVVVSSTSQLEAGREPK